MGWIVNGTPALEAASEYRTVIVICVVSSVLMAFVVAARLYIRRTRLAVEDGVVILGAILSILYNIFAIMQTKYGLGLPPATRPAQDLLNYTLYNYGGRPFLIVGLICFKFALCLTYLRMIDRTSHRYYRISIYIFMTLLVSICIFTLGFNLFSCSPLAKNLNPLLPGTCLPYAPWNLTTWSLNIVLDFAVFLFPIPLFMRMSIDFGLRLELSILFSLSLAATALSIWKVSQVVRIAYGDGNSTQFVYLSCLEVNVGLIVSCLPHLKPLYNWRKHFSSGSRGRSNGHKDYRMSRLHSTPKKEVTSKVDELRSESQDRILHPNSITKTTFITVNHGAEALESPELNWK